MIYATAKERFWAKVDTTGSCWLWQASTDKAGYGTFGLEGKVWKAHRVAYLLTHGSIPEGAHILHSCDRPACVNPEHLRAGTRAENMQDKIQRGRDPRKNQTHCKRGHAFDEENTYIVGNGRRNCKRCRNDMRRAWRARTREAA